MDSIRIAVLGAGYWGTKVAREYASMDFFRDNALLVSVSDSSAQALSTIQNELQSSAIRFSKNIQDVLEDPSVDAVHIALPNQLHYEVGRMALESGKHVLLEKPMSTSSREAFKLARLSEEMGLVLQVGHIFRFNNAIRTLKQILQQGRIGRILYGSIVWSAFIRPPEDRDIIFDLAPHPIDILNFVLDEWPISVDAIGSSYLRQKPNAEEVAFVNMRFPNEFLANVYVSWIQHGKKERTIMIVGDKATVYCDALNQIIHIFDKSNPTSKIGIEVESNNTIRDMQFHFFDQIRRRGPQLSSPLIGATTVQILENIVRSMRQKTDQAAEVALLKL